MCIEFDSIPTVSSAIEKLQQILINNIGKDNIYGTVANGTFPLVVHVDNEVSLSPPFFCSHFLKLIYKITVRYSPAHQGEE